MKRSLILLGLSILTLLGVMVGQVCGALGAPPLSRNYHAGADGPRLGSVPLDKAHGRPGGGGGGRGSGLSHQGRNAGETRGGDSTRCEGLG